MKLAELYSAAPNFASSNNYSDESGEMGLDIPSESRDHLSDEELSQLRRSSRIRKTPDYLATNEIERVPYS